MADGLLSVLDERLAPAGHEHRRPLSCTSRASCTTPRSRWRSSRSSRARSTLTNPTVKRSDAGYALLEAARAYFGFAVRLRSRVTGQHASRAGEPLRAGLRKLAEDVEPRRRVSCCTRRRTR